MNVPHDGLRKAAILVTCLDQAAADKLLEQLLPGQAQQVRRLVVELDDVDPQEQRRVMDEFFRIGPLLPDKSLPGIELDSRLAERFCRPAGDRPQEWSGPGTGLQDPRPFHFLEEAEGDQLAKVLNGERPQTIALVLSHLPPARAGNLLGRLPPALQVEVIRRLANLEETDPEILREVEDALQARLSQQIELPRRRAAGLQAVAGILDAADGVVSARILDTLAAYDQPLAEKLCPQDVALEFEDLVELDDARLAAVLDAAGPELTLLALIGAEPELIARVVARFPAAQAKAIRARLDRPGPVRLRDVEEARRQVAAVARRMMLRSERDDPQAVSYVS